MLTALDGAKIVKCGFRFYLLVVFFQRHLAHFIVVAIFVSE